MFSKGILPIKIGQIASAKTRQGKPLQIDGIQPLIVTIIGKIQTIQVQSNLITMECSDDTGSIVVKYWNEEFCRDSSPFKFRIVNFQHSNFLSKTNTFILCICYRVGENIRIIGIIMNYLELLYLMAPKIIKVSNKKEIQLHILEAEYAHQHNIRQIQEVPFWEKMFAAPPNDNLTKENKKNTLNKHEISLHVSNENGHESF